MIIVSDYDPAWPNRFTRLATELTAVLESRAVRFVSIEHVGSTSVPGLAAKPVIDCDIVVTPEYVSSASRALEDVGYISLGELGIPQRWAFKEPAEWAGSNVYVVVEGSLSLRNHLAVRDTLRRDPTLRELYGATKKLVASTARDLDEYGAGKSDIIQDILAVAGFSVAERRSINAAQVPSHTELPR